MEREDRPHYYENPLPQVVSKGGNLREMTNLIYSACPILSNRMIHRVSLIHELWHRCIQKENIQIQAGALSGFNKFSLFFKVTCFFFTKKPAIFLHLFIKGNIKNGCIKLKHDGNKITKGMVFFALHS